MSDTPDALAPVPPCPRCKAAHVVRNGPNAAGTPSYRCRACARRFVERPLTGPVPGETKALVERLLVQSHG